MDLRQHVRPISGQQIDGAIGDMRRPWRILPIVAVIFAALLLGAALGRALPMKAEAGAVAQSAPVVQSAPAVQFSPAAQSSEPFVYFPSQYVNQAAEAEEHIQAY